MSPGCKPALAERVYEGVVPKLCCIRYRLELLTLRTPHPLCQGVCRSSEDDLQLHLQNDVPGLRLTTPAGFPVIIIEMLCLSVEYVGLVDADLHTSKSSAS
jgi:hypothetical protein